MQTVRTESCGCFATEPSRWRTSQVDVLFIGLHTSSLSYTRCDNDNSSVNIIARIRYGSHLVTETQTNLHVHVLIDTR